VPECLAVLARRMHASGESASTIALTLGVSRATVYRVPPQVPAEQVPSVRHGPSRDATVL